MSEWMLLNALLVLGYAFYESYLTKVGAAKGNRVFLLGWMVVSIVLPVLALPQFVSEAATSVGVTYVLPEVLTNTEADASVFTGYSLLLSLYVAASIVLLFTKGIQAFKISGIVRRAESKERYGVTYRMSHEVEMPFTFFNRIVIPASLKEEELLMVLKHEQAHVRAMHGLDLLVIQCLQLLNWFNPVVWFYEKAIRMNHEYEADEAVLYTVENVSEYKALLLSRAISVPSFMLSHAMANKSQLQKRFTMMNSKRKNNLSYYLMIVPLFALALLTKACAEQEATPMPATPEATAKEEVRGEESPVVKEADVMPEFPGGQQELFSYIGSSVQYPEQAKKEGLTGKVFVRFTVGDDGSVNNAEVLKSDNEIFNEEALRVISGMPKWTPGEKDGKAVSVSLVLPIMFALSE